MNEHEALLPKNKTRVVERGALKTILIAFCGAAVLAGVAVPRGGRGGGLRGAPTALKAAALKSAPESGLVRDVDPSRWAIECVQPYQEVNAVVQPFYGTDFSNYDLINNTAGGHVGKLHDQMTALSDIYRISGAQHLTIDFAVPLFPKVTAFHPSAPGDKILGGTEYNHITNDEFGPLKSNHSKLCPVTLTHAEKEEQCLSLQEGVWGTDGLARREAIKAKIDPQGLFQCQKCVGFKGPVRDQ